MNLGLAILLIVLAFAGGVALGIYLSRRQVENYIADKPILDENALRLMMSQMGQNQARQKYNKYFAKSRANKKWQARKNNQTGTGIFIPRSHFE